MSRLASLTNDLTGGTANDLTVTFAYNPAGQISATVRTGDAYAFTGLNQYTTAGPASFTYDAAGNLTGDGMNAYVYDGENRLVSATAAGVTTTLTYDPLGRLWRVQNGTADTRFLTDGDAVVGEYDATGALVARYVHGSNAAADDPLVWYAGSNLATARYLHADRLGSIVAATNAAAAPSINTYDEYGIPGAANTAAIPGTLYSIAAAASEQTPEAPRTRCFTCSVCTAGRLSGVYQWTGTGTPRRLPNALPPCPARPHHAAH